MSELDAPLSAVAGLTKRQVTALKSLNLNTLKDLIFHFPARHEDFTLTTTIRNAPVGEHVTLVARVVKVGARHSFRRHLSMAEATLDDGTGRVTAVWFNQPYLAKMLPVDTVCRFAGKLTRTKLGLRLINPLYERDVQDASAYAMPLVPIYPTAAGVSQHLLRRLLFRLQPLWRELPDHLPADLRQRLGLEPLSAALDGIHFPKTTAQLEAARRRLGFDEMFRLQLLVTQAKLARTTAAALAVPFDEAVVKSFVAALPFKLTDDQRRAAWEILQDMGRSAPMCRLLDGDVGSGKTAVAAIAMANAAAQGCQSALMAPTEILACQHYETLKRLFAGRGVKIALWTHCYKRSSAGARETEYATARRAAPLARRIATGGVQVVVGTHALVEESFRFGNLALAIIDEQHRFGVRTRQRLREQGGRNGQEPHLLSMTATPIPRSLALTVYGDLDLSILKQKPRNRRPVITRLVPEARRAGAYEFMRREITAGRQVFIVCPLIDPSDSLGAASTTAEAERLRRGEFAGISLAVLHGKLKAEDKERVMRDFFERRTAVLVSTSVVEVGVDVPNATVMCIEGAERFGLAQLHQFRGRVGRGEFQSYCLLFPTTWSDAVAARLGAVVATDDGFVLAEKDLKLRGPGELLGETQSGFPPLQLAALGDLRLVKEARSEAEKLLSVDPSLTQQPQLAAWLAEFGSNKPHLE